MTMIYIEDDDRDEVWRERDIMDHGDRQLWAPMRAAAEVRFEMASEYLAGERPLSADVIVGLYIQDIIGDRPLDMDGDPRWLRELEYEASSGRDMRTWLASTAESMQPWLDQTPATIAAVDRALAAEPRTIERCQHNDPIRVAERSAKRLFEMGSIGWHNDTSRQEQIDAACGAYLEDRLTGLTDPGEIRRVMDEVDRDLGRDGRMARPGSDVSAVPLGCGSEEERVTIANLAALTRGVPRFDLIIRQLEARDVHVDREDKPLLTDQEARLRVGHQMLEGHHYLYRNDPVNASAVVGVYLIDQMATLTSQYQMASMMLAVDKATGQGGQVAVPGADTDKVPAAVVDPVERQMIANLMADPHFAADPLMATILSKLQPPTAEQQRAAEMAAAEPWEVADRTEIRLKAADEYAYLGKPPTVDALAGLYLREKLAGVDDPKEVKRIMDQVDAETGRGGKVLLPGADVSKVPEGVGTLQERRALANLQTSPDFADAQYFKVILQHVSAGIDRAGKVIGQISRDLAQV